MFRSLAPTVHLTRTAIPGSSLRSAPPQLELTGHRMRDFPHINLIPDNCVHVQFRYSQQHHLGHRYLTGFGSLQKKHALLTKRSQRCVHTFCFQVCISTRHFIEKPLQSTRSSAACESDGRNVNAPERCGLHRVDQRLKLHSNATKTAPWDHETYRQQDTL
jgi:hypothetical protein